MEVDIRWVRVLTAVSSFIQRALLHNIIIIIAVGGGGGGWMVGYGSRYDE